MEKEEQGIDPNKSVSMAGVKAPINMSVYQGWGEMPDSKKSMLLADLLKEDPAGQSKIAMYANQAMGQAISNRALALPGIDTLAIGQDKYIADRRREGPPPGLGLGVPARGVRDRMEQDKLRARWYSQFSGGVMG
jgi:hypothetical protein